MIKTAAGYPLPEHMRAWVLGDPGQLSLVDKPIPMPGRAEVLVRVDAVGICATDLEIIRRGAPAMIRGGAPFNKMFTPGHEYMGTVAALGLGVDEYRIGQRVTVEVHAGCGQCKRCRDGMYTACLNYGLNYGDVDKGHRASGLTTDGGFAVYAVNNVNTLVAIPDGMSDFEATLVVTAGTAMYGLVVDFVPGDGRHGVNPGVRLRRRNLGRLRARDLDGPGVGERARFEVGSQSASRLRDSTTPSAPLLALSVGNSLR